MTISSKSGHDRGQGATLHVPSFGAWRPGLLGLGALLAWGSAASATDLIYTLNSPAFGGGNSSALQAAQMQQGLKNAKTAAAAAALKASTPPDPNQPFVNAIISQLNGVVAQTIAQRIANAQDGQAGVIRSGTVTISYANSDGQLSVTITTPTGTTTLTVPSV